MNKDCNDLKKLPNLIFKFKTYDSDTTFDITLKPQDYVLQFEIDGKKDCVVGIGPDLDDSSWTLGQIFFKTIYTIFDRDNHRIGFSNIGS